MQSLGPPPPSPRPATEPLCPALNRSRCEPAAAEHQRPAAQATAHLPAQLADDERRHAERQRRAHVAGRRHHAHRRALAGLRHVARDDGVDRGEGHALAHAQRHARRQDGRHARRRRLGRQRREERPERHAACQHALAAVLVGQAAAQHLRPQHRHITPQPALSGSASWHWMQTRVTHAGRNCAASTPRPQYAASVGIRNGLMRW